MVDAYVSMPYDTTVRACSGGTWSIFSLGFDETEGGGVLSRPDQSVNGCDMARRLGARAGRIVVPVLIDAVREIRQRSAKSLTECAVSAPSSLYSHLNGEDCQGSPDPQPKRDGFT